jgi:integrase
MLSVIDSPTTLSTAHRNARAYRDVASWLDERETEGKATRTLDSDERISAALLNAYPEHELEDFTRDDMMAFFADVTPAQRNKYRSHVASFFKWCILTDRLSANPMDKVPAFRKPKRKVINVYSEAEVELLCSVDLKYRLLFDAGLRFTEARMMQGKHILFDLSDPEHPTGRVAVMRGKGGKGRLVTMTMRLTTAMADLFALEGINPDDYLWGTRPGGHRVRRREPACESVLREWHERSQKAAGVGYRNFHTTRHTCATFYLRRGVSMLAVSKMLGHEQIETTVNQYAHLTIDDFAAELAVLGV